MPKAYWIAHVKVTDPETYKKYIETAAPAFREFGARFLARGGSADPVEAPDLGPRHVVIEFESMERARQCYNSPAYQAAIKHRQAAATGKLLIVEGVD
jgi:uncharacterized protein (DUF1330 family)